MAEPANVRQSPRVFMFCRRLYPEAIGGREIFVAQLVEHLALRGCNVLVLSQTRRAWPRPNVTNLKVASFNVPILGTLLFAISAIWTAAVHQDRFDVVHTHSPRLNVVLGALISKLVSRSHVITVHCATTADALRDLGAQTAYQTAATVVAISPSVARAVRSQVGPLAQVVVIPSATHVAGERRPRREVRRELGLGDDDLIVLFVGRLDPHKQPRLLLRAFEFLGQSFLEEHRVRLVFAGPGSEEERLANEIRMALFRSSVRLLGPVSHDHALDLMSASDIFVLPSRHEGLGLSVVEAFFSALPVVASDAEGLRDLVANGRTGLLFPVGDAEALAESLRELISNPRRRAAVASLARSHAKMHFDFGSVVAAHFQLYSGLMRASIARVPKPSRRNRGPEATPRVQRRRD